MFACIYIPDFPVQASLLSERAETRTALSRSPVAILDGPANLLGVFATNSAARRAGIQTGMTKLQAEICQGVELRKRSLAEEESAQSALLDCAGKFSPRVESTAPGAAILDLAGTEKLFNRKNGYPLNDGRQNDRQNSLWLRAVNAITTKAAEAGFDARVVLAPNPDTAFLAARGFSANTIIPIGKEARSLAPLPIETLPVSPEMLETLNSWGIRTFQSLAALPEVAIVERLGQEGLYIQKLARGTIVRPLLAIEPNEEFVASFEFDDPVETLESIFFILDRLLHDLCVRLLFTAQAATELRLTVGLNVRQIQDTNRKGAPSRISTGIGEDHRHVEEDDEQFQHEWKLSIPTQDKNLLFSLVRLHLEKTIFSAPVRCLRLEVVPVKPRLAQGSLFAPPSPEPEKLEITLERIRGIVGATDAEGTACVGSPCLLDTHKPDSFALQNFSTVHDAQQNSHPERTGVPSAPGFGAMEWRSKQLRKVDLAKSQPGFSSLRPSLLTNSISPNSSLQSAPVIALRIFRPAVETAVQLNGDKPHFVHLWSRHRHVLAASGPWSSSGNWWNAAAWMREEWDVALQTPAGIGFYRIYRDRLRGQWFVEGVFD